MIICWRGKRRKEEEKRKKKRKGRGGGLRRAYRTVKSLVCPPAVVVAVHRHNPLSVLPLLHVLILVLLYIYINKSICLDDDEFRPMSIDIHLCILSGRTVRNVRLLQQRWQTHCASSWGSSGLGPPSGFHEICLFGILLLLFSSHVVTPTLYGVHSPGKLTPCQYVESLP